MYNRLRDYKVPTPILDNIFSNDEDILILEKAWNALIDDGFKEDPAAEEISKIIFKDLDILPDQSFNEEK